MSKAKYLTAWEWDQYDSAVASCIRIPLNDPDPRKQFLRKRYVEVLLAYKRIAKRREEQAAKDAEMQALAEHAIKRQERERFR